MLVYRDSGVGIVQGVIKSNFLALFSFLIVDYTKLNLMYVGVENTQCFYRYHVMFI